MKSKPLFFDGAEWDYYGELDKYGNACGWGKATQRTCSKMERVFEGSFVDNLRHGFGFLTEKEKNETNKSKPRFLYTSEFKSGTIHGKRTSLEPSGKILN